MMDDDGNARLQIVEYCKWLHKKNMLAAADGNVSVRLSDGRILITPSGLPKAFIDPSEICEINLDRPNKVSGVGRPRPSSESQLHLAIYDSCPAAAAVVHAHPVSAIALSIAHPEWAELPSQAMSELILAVGKIPIVPYARPSTSQMGENLQPFLPDCRIMILARHGGLSWGESLLEAYMGMERLEHSAQVLALAQLVGGITFLPPDEVEALKIMRQKMGCHTL